MNLKSPHLWIGLVSATAVLFVAVVDMRRKSPGPLTRVHGREGDLVGAFGCNECHGGWGRSMATACLDCHEDVAEHLETGRGLHGTLGEAEAGRCATCHSDHHGKDFLLVNAASFAQAGVPDVDAFEHDLVGFAMAGGHLELDCTECHEHADAGVLPEDARRFMGLTQDCSACHDDAHEGRMHVSCTSCHGQVAFDEFEAPGHDAVLPLIGGHGDVECRTCHEPAGEHSLDRLGGVARATVAHRACADCHESPHADRLLAGVAALVATGVEDGCVVCHVAEHESFREDSIDMSAERHACSGFPLDAPHADVSCADCHGPAERPFEERYPGRGRDDCHRCHEDAHAGQFATGPFAGLGCVACHDRHAFEPHAFTVATHERTAFALEGAHARTECDACHAVPTAPADAPRTFRGTAATCEACHTDAHAGYFADGAADLEPSPAGECARCHGTERFDLLPQPFDHGAWTDFAVRGAHAQAACEVCHVPRAAADVHGRRFGTVEEHFGPYTGCVTCHADPHAGAFDGQGRPPVVQGRRDCARCHVQSSFRKVPDDFDHGRWTGFLLDGAHANVSCADCHAPRLEPGEDGRTWERARGSACADCHDDPHAGQFAKAGRVDCARCHESTADFGILSFNHEWDARFKLGDAHREVACSACHARVSDGGKDFVRYRPMGRECADCHGVRDGPLRRRRRGKY